MHILYNGEEVLFERKKQADTVNGVITRQSSSRKISNSFPDIINFGSGILQTTSI
jgi:hypothetical protein